MSESSMATTEKNGAVRTKEKTARSKRLYWSFGTIVVAAVLFTFYVSGYVSSQQAYYNERAFRLLSSMADKFALHVRIADNVLRASASFPNAGKANDYIHTVLHSKIEDRDFTITNWHKLDETAVPNRQGLLTLFEPETTNSFRIRADYREITAKVAKDTKNKKDTKTQKGTEKSQGADDTKEIAPPEKPCTGGTPTDITLCATINFDPLVRPSFRDLEEGFFDDILIVDSDGNVLYQESLQGIRIQNISGLRFSQDNAGSGGLPFKLSSQSAQASGAST